MSTAVASPPKGTVKRMKVRQIATLFPLSLDSAATLWLLRQFGMTRFVGASQAKLVFWPGGLETPDKRPVADWEADGVLPINCGGGTFDHHPHGKYPHDCTFTLALKALGLEKDPRFKLMMEYIYWDDTRAFARVDYPELAIPQKEEMKFSLSRMFKDKQSRVKRTGDDATDQENMRKVAQTALYSLYVDLDTHIKVQEEFFVKGKAAFLAADQHKVTDKNGKTWQLVQGETDCDQFAAYARSEYSNFTPSVVVQVRPNGHTQILGTNKMNLNFVKLAQTVRLKEFQLRGRVLGAVTMNEFCQEGTMEVEVPEWFLMPGKSADGSSMLLNGSHRHPAVPPTIIKPHLLKKIILDWLQDDPLGK